MPKYAPVYMDLYDGEDIVLSELGLTMAEGFEDGVPDDVPVDTVVATVTGNTENSTLTLDSSSFALDGVSIKSSATPLVVGDEEISITEALAGADNTPRTTELTITVVASSSEE